MSLTCHHHSACTAAILARAEATCAARGSRLTSQRRDVLGCVAEGHDAVGAYEIIERMAKHGGRPAPITVYRALEFLLEQGLVHKIESRNAYVVCTHEHHKGEAVLLICQSCGLVTEQEGQEIFATLKALAQHSSFSPRQTMVELTGLCADCQTKPALHPASEPPRAHS